MLQMADESPAGESSERIRVWQFDQPVVVLGRSSRVADEVNREVCEQHGIPLHRRSSGGATVLGGPGCLMYSVVLSFDDQRRFEEHRPGALPRHEASDRSDSQAGSHRGTPRHL